MRNDGVIFLFLSVRHFHLKIKIGILENSIAGVSIQSILKLRTKCVRSFTKSDLIVNQSTNCNLESKINL